MWERLLSNGVIPCAMNAKPTRFLRNLYPQEKKDRVENERRLLGPPNFTDRKQFDKKVSVTNMSCLS